MENKDIISIADHFLTHNNISKVEPLGKGLINDTFLVLTDSVEEKYVLQRINGNVFPDAHMVMDNILKVTTHLRKKYSATGVVDLDRRVLRFVPLKADETKYHVEVGGSHWRMMLYINGVTKQTVNAENSRAAGRAFGEFQAMLADIPYELGETIKDFHNMEFRLQQLREVIAKDPAGRVGEPEVQELLCEIDKRADCYCMAERFYREGKLPKRICHCDTKVNNMLFDDEGNVLAVIDLDTVMPNFIFSDYGDFLRTAANTVAEDEQDMTKVSFRKDIYEAFTEGYLSATESFLTPLEREMLPWAVALFPYMQCVRFLWAYIDNNQYWKTDYPRHNFVRALNQFTLLKQVEAVLIS